MSLCYGYYGDSRMQLGPSSSRLLKTSSVFVKRVKVRDDNKKGVLLYGSNEMPQLVLERNWSVSCDMNIRSHSQEGFSLWLNEGSSVHMRWEAETSKINHLRVVMVKGERRHEETLLPKSTIMHKAKNLNDPIKIKEAEYVIDKDDRYSIGFLNSNPRSFIMIMTINVTSKIYDISKAKKICSTIKGACCVNLLFPKTQYVVVTTPDDGDTGGWYIELSFVARVLTYIGILGFIIVVILVILKYLGVYEDEMTMNTMEEPIRVDETTLAVEDKSIRFYGTSADDEEERLSSSSSDDLYDAKLCVICYDDQRNCFFVPCGHCATCYDCAQRLMAEENKICPICRRLVHKVRRLFSIDK